MGAPAQQARAVADHLAGSASRQEEGILEL